MSRQIYARDYTKIKEVYSDHNIPADLGVVIGAITETDRSCFGIGAEGRTDQYV